MAEWKPIQARAHTAIPEKEKGALLGALVQTNRLTKL